MYVVGGIITPPLASLGLRLSVSWVAREELYASVARSDVSKQAIYRAEMGWVKSGDFWTALAAGAFKCIALVIGQSAMVLLKEWWLI